jgi:hypothetical protein
MITHDGTSTIILSDNLGGICTVSPAELVGDGIFAISCNPQLSTTGYLQVVPSGTGQIRAGIQIPVQLGPVVSVTPGVTPTANPTTTTTTTTQEELPESKLFGISMYLVLGFITMTVVGGLLFYYALWVHRYD